MQDILDNNGTVMCDEIKVTGTKSKVNSRESIHEVLAIRSHMTEAPESRIVGEEV